MAFNCFFLLLLFFTGLKISAGWNTNFAYVSTVQVT